MRISQVAIRNFRSLRKVSISFDDVTTLIGPNGTGKSSVLRALDWFFNGSKSADLSEEDCSFGATDQNIEVQVTFSGISETDRSELGKYVPSGVDTFTAWKIRTPDGQEYLSANAKGLPDFSAIKAAVSVGGEGGKKELYAALCESRPELALAPATTGIAIDSAMTSWEAEHTDLLIDLPESLQTNFFGFNSGGKMSGLFDFVFVTADLRASEESQDAKASIIGRILERTIDRSVVDDAISEIVELSRVAQQKVYDEKFTEQLHRITSRLNMVVGSYTPGRSISVTPSSIELKAPRTTFDVKVLDGASRTDVERQGHGFQRTLLISALQVLALEGAASAEGVICLAIEEPELFQHPIQAIAFAKVLRSLAEDPNQNIQVTYATHSPYFVEASKFGQVRRLVRTNDERAEVTVHSSSLEIVKSLLDGVVKPSVVDDQLNGTISTRLPVALFANRVLLVEGTTEVAVLYGIADRSRIGELEALGVSVVDAGGKGTLPLSHAILTSIGIPTYSMFDCDSGCEDRARSNGLDATKMAAERNRVINENHRLLKYFNLPIEDFPTQTVTDSVTVLEDHLEALLANEWPEWQTSCSQYEDTTEVQLKKNQMAYRKATLDSFGEPSPTLSLVIKKSISIKTDSSEINKIEHGSHPYSEVDS